MKKISKTMICLSLMGQLSGVQVNAEEVSAPYVLTQSINNIPVEKARCIELLRNYTTNKEGDSDTAQQLVENIARLNQDIEVAATQFNESNEKIAQLEQSRQQATEQHMLTIEATYEDYSSQDADFDHLSEEEQLALLSSNERVREWQQALDDIEQQLNAEIAQRDQLEKQHQQLLYELDTQTSQLEQDKQIHSQLNQCLLYPYSVQREELGQLLINTQVTDLKELLVNLDVYLQRMVPLAYRKVHFDTIAALFNTAQSAQTIEAQLYGKPVIQLDDNGREYYTYARELNSWDIEILANLALRDYFAMEDMSQLYERYSEVLAMKEGQFAYFYAINHEAFEQMKQLLVDYLNAHQLWDSHTVTQLKAFHERYQMKLALFDEGSQQWRMAPEGESGYYQMYMALDLVQPQLVESPAVISEESSAETSSEPSRKANTSRLDTLKEKLKRPVKENVDSAKSLSQSKRDKTSDESSSSQAKSQLTKPRETANKTVNKTKQSTRADLPSAESASEQSSLKDERKSGINLPSTGEQAFILWIAIALLIVGVAILIWDIYLRYKKRKALEKIKLD